MIPRPLVRLLALLSLLAAAAAPARAAAPSRAPNVILFLIDDWGWTDAGCQGSRLYETPHIDRLAAQGMRFTSAYSACTVCSPTRAAVMTGKYPARLHLTDWISGHVRPYAPLQIPDWTKYLPLEERTVAEELRARGYATGIFGKWHLGGEAFYPEKQGFDVNVGGCDRGQPGSYFPPYGIVNVRDERPGEFLSDRLTRDAISFIEANRDRPFFVYFPHYAVHTPLAGKPEVIAKYQRKLAAGQYTQTNATYAALVESVDDSVGAVVRRLAELKLDDNTLVILTGDNGGLSGTVNAQGWRPGPTRNDPLRLGKGSAYEGGVRVPLIARWPGVIRAGTTCDVPVTSVDYFPTLLAAAGGAAAPATDGVSLLPLFRGGDRLSRDAIFWHYPHYHPGGATPYSAVRMGDWRLVHFYEGDRVELYDLARDIGESTNLAASEPAKVKELRARLDAWRTAVGAQPPVPNARHDPARTWEEAGRPAAGKAKKA